MNELMADDGLRVLALAYNRLPDSYAPGEKRDKVEEDLVFVGLVGIKDPPRDGVTESIEICERAGIAVHMLTGDHPATSTAIARQIGIIGLASQLPADAVMTSTQFDQLTPEQLVWIATTSLTRSLTTSEQTHCTSAAAYMSDAININHSRRRTWIACRW
jgi:Na+-exporting ATPase